MEFLCPACRKPFELTHEEFPRYAGKKARCPSCREVMEIPEKPPVKVPLAVVPAVQQVHPTLPPSPIFVQVPTVPRRNSPWKRPMAVVTILWIIAIPVMSLILFVSHIAGHDLGRGTMIVNDQFVSRDSFIGYGMVNSAISGLCCTTVPYMIAMTLLLVLHVASRD